MQQKNHRNDKYILQLYTTTWVTLMNQILSKGTQTIWFYLYKISKMAKMFYDVENQNSGYIWGQDSSG